MRKILLSLCVVCVLVGQVQAAVIYLKDGTQIHGTIVSATARDYQVQTADGLRSVTSDQIRTIDYAVQPAAPAPDSGSLQQSFRRHWFSLGLGLANPLSQVDFSSVGGGRDDNGDVGFLFSPQYLYGVSPRLGLGGSVEFANRGRIDSQNLLPFSNTQVQGHDVMLMGLAKYSFVERGSVRPYLLGGLGAHHSSLQINAQPNPGFAWSDTDTDEPRSLVDDSHWGLASTLRLGVDFSWASPTVFALEVGWTHLSSPSYNPTPAGQDLALAPITGTQNKLDLVFRWGWRF